MLGQSTAAVEADLEPAVIADIVRETHDRSERRTNYLFNHAVLREAAYAELTSNEHTAAHRAAGSWLAEQPGADPSVIAWHFERGSDQRLALPWFVAAARAALVGGEPARAQQLADEAMTGAVDSSDVVAIELLRADALVALGNTGEGLRAAEAALSQARTGSLPWLRAASLVVNCAGQRGDNDTVERSAKSVCALEPEADAEAEWVRCLCQAATQLFAAGKFPEAQVFGTAAIRRGSDRPEAQARLAHLRAALAIREQQLEQGIECLAAAARFHALAGNLRASALMRVLRSVHARLCGRPRDRGTRPGCRGKSRAAYRCRLLPPMGGLHARGNLALTGDPWAAKAHLESVRRELPDNPRIIAGTHIYAALAALRCGDGQWAEDESRRALDAHDFHRFAR